MKHVNVSLFVPHAGCPHTCSFCNQKAISGKTQPLRLQDITSACETAKACAHDIENSEIAFFGGSFTAIERERMTAYLEAAQPYVGTQFGGIRISTRPDCISEEILEILKRYGVTSVELGAQSMDNGVLALNERGHTAEDTEKACGLIRRYGFSLGLQMMTGLYGSDDEKDRYTARCFIRLHPDTVRIYPTVVLENTRLAEYYRQGLYTPPGTDEAAGLCADLLTMFRENGIRVIRLGLHSGGGVEEGYIAGSYHPAFRELCEGIIYRKKAEELLRDKPAGEYTVYVSPREISKMTGQKKCNTEYFEKAGYILAVKGDETLAAYEVSVSKGIYSCT